jgi:adenylylsulfate kinase
VTTGTRGAGPGAVVWITGLPSAGKTTLAARLARRLRDTGRQPLVLDGDDVRALLHPRPGYDEEGREAFYETLIELATLAARQGLVAIVAATAHRRAWRDRARELAPRFVEVHVATPLAECRRRDPKRLYADLADNGALPGAGTSYEPPVCPEVVAPLGDDPRAVEQIIDRLR